MVDIKRHCNSCIILTCSGGVLICFILWYAIFCSLTLEVWDVKANQLLLSLPTKAGDSFSLQYTHSTAKTIIEEQFQIAGRNDIIATHMIFVSVGAGIPDVTPPQGAKFRIGSDGRFVLDNINKHFKILPNIRVAYYYPFTLVFKGNKRDLREIAQSRLVDIKVRSRFVKYL